MCQVWPLFNYPFLRSTLEKELRISFEKLPILRTTVKATDRSGRVGLGTSTWEEIFLTTDQKQNVTKKTLEKSRLEPTAPNCPANRSARRFGARQSIGQAIRCPPIDRLGDLVPANRSARRFGAVYVLAWTSPEFVS